MRPVALKPMAFAVAVVRSHVRPLTNGPRSTTGTTIDSPWWRSATSVPQGSDLWATPSSLRVSQAVLRP
jgi:hypothetical protein